MKKLFNTLSVIINNRTRWAAIGIPVLILGILFFIVTMNNVISETYDIERFNRAKTTIRSPITIENKAETERKVHETLQAVSDRYTVSETITEERINYIEELFDAFEKVMELENETVEEVDEEEKTADGMMSAHEREEQQELSYEEIVIQLTEILSPEITESLSDFTLMRLMQIEPAERNRAKKVFIQSVEKVLSNGVRTENIQSAREEVKNSLKYSNLNDNVKNTFEDLISFTIVENSFFDVDKTTEAKNKAADNVEPVKIRAGDIIVREGQIITNEMYEELKLVGLLKQQRNIFPTAGLIILTIFLVSLIGYELNRLYKKNKLDKATITSVLLISIIVVITMKLVGIFTTEKNTLFFIVPIATGSLLFKILITERLSIVLSVIFAILGAIIFNGDLSGSLNIEAFIYLLFFQIASIVFLTNFKDRTTIMKATIGMAFVNIMTITLFILLTFQNFDLITLLVHIGYGIVAAIVSSVLTLGLLPFFETGLGILSDNKLLTLANPNQPLIKKILTEVPGTYHHSVMVANLSESACEAIGANGLLARVGAYYHDIGKAVKPQYFIENQMGIRNPHDFISPEESAEIIINHVIDGAKMLEDHQLPKEIVDIARQHHGTSLVEYFYRQAKNNNAYVSEDDFRYPGPKPQTKETAIISICDAVEAAVRSLNEPSPEKIEEIVKSIINNKLMDGQLDETPLTLKELQIIQHTICEALKGIFHSRIQYPDVEEEH